ncbi:MAG TPA: N-acetyltransferase [Candidatus Angelobacter sp.]|jgi:ribosomal protein S18 acetylase RimI-like enzyme|nr:N-acetyltransferase [Candidatus Angelobacter sp.]
MFSVLRVRPYQLSDFSRLLEIDQACFVAGIAYSEEELSYFLSIPTSISLVGVQNVGLQNAGVQNEEIMGFIVADTYRSRRSSRSAGKIITIDVAPQAQNSGLGTLLMSSVEAGLQDAGCDYVSLEVAVDNEPALRFYKKHAYSVLKVLPRYYLDSIDGLLMGKKL